MIWRAFISLCSCFILENESFIDGGCCYEGICPEPIVTLADKQVVAISDVAVEDFVA